MKITMIDTTNATTGLTCAGALFGTSVKKAGSFMATPTVATIVSA